jgi:hypothetical protein
MEPILQINQIRSGDENFSEYRITITQGAELIDSEDVLLNTLKDTVPYKKGIIEVLKISSSIWEIKTNK